MDKKPALSAFAASFETELVFGQVWIRRTESGFELRHAIDRDLAPAGLRLIACNELRPLAQLTENGAFRPLKSAPNLRRGWRAMLPDTEALGAALNQLYPGAVADWFAAQAPQPPVTSYRDFTGRQTGMYRITTHLNDLVAGAAIRACCHADFCLKRRWWTVDGLAPDSPPAKSAIPCLEPCAIMLEFARKIARLEQEQEGKPPPSAVEIQRQRIHAQESLRRHDASVAESDFDTPANPRRLRFVLEKSLAAVKPTVA